MKKKKMKVSYCFLLLGILLSMPIYAQQAINVKGVVTDAMLGTP